MPSANRPWWQQATALVSLGAGGAITGLSFVPQPAAELTSPSGMPIGLMALQQSAGPTQADNAALRSAITSVANYYLRMAESKTAAEMEAIIWQRDSLDGVDHGQSCAAFASLTLELGAHVVGRQSWVTGGGSYPWPLHKWADVRVNPNPGSPGVTSIVQDAQAHQRWHAVGDGYLPQPGDWVVFDGHVEVVTKYAGGVLHTIGGDSLPNFSVNAHEYGDPLSAQGVVGFVDNGDLPTTTADTAAASAAPASDAAPGTGGTAEGTTAIPGALAAAGPSGQPGPAAASPAIPGTATAPGPSQPSQPGPAGRSSQAGPAGPPSQPGPAGQSGQSSQPRKSGVPGRSGPPARQPAEPAGSRLAHRGQADGAARSPAGARAGVPGAYLSGAGAWTRTTMADTATIPGLPMMAHRLPGHAAAQPTSPYRRHSPSQGALPARGTSAQQAFIGAVAPAAVATQRKYGVPASVTIAQAIDESGWGQSNLAVNEHNLFGIKGTGPAGSYRQQTQEYENGQLVNATGSFRVYRTTAESVDDHGRLLATSGYYRRAMAVRGNPDAFAASLTGVYATDPDYGTKIIRLMKQYDLYRYDSIASAAGAAQSAPRPAPSASAAPGQASHAHPAARPATTPAGAATAPAGAAPSTPAPATAAPLASIPGAEGPGTRAPGAAAAAAPGTPSSAKAGPRQSAARAGSSAAAIPAPRAGSAPAADHARTHASAPGTAATRRAAQATAAREGAAQATAGTTRPAPGRSAAAGTVPATASTKPPAPATSPAGGAAPGAARTKRPAPGAAGASRAAPGTRASSGGAPGTASIPGVPAPRAAGSARTAPASSPRARPRPDGRSGPAAGQAEAAPSTQTVSARLLAAQVSTGPRRSASRPARASSARYRPQIPPAVRSAYVTRAKEPLFQAEPLYRDVAEHSGIGWELLAACDWMQCRARERYSPVHGEKLGTVNADGSCYRTKSESLAQCADELAALAWTVYGLDLAARGNLSVRDLANVFAAFRWGGLLRRHRTSAMEFPYSVAGLTAQHVKMRWPNIDEPNAPDRPGGRFRVPFGALPVVLFLGYPATV